MDILNNHCHHCHYLVFLLVLNRLSTVAQMDNLDILMNNTIHDEGDTPVRIPPCRFRLYDNLPLSFTLSHTHFHYTQVHL
jgi:hypothetical protein